ncbi:hypothetical protein V9T40_003756 [Parthenolecanium corni]|uniref:tRNA (adenine(58)-N(1))-methyltransferase non-catalytic subunit TRM6 n=1 Tax=Parthenolecanium corni TaxID=536013 RepID=A0AAN9TRW3_9HEMI
MDSESDIVQCKDYVILKRGNHIILHQLTKKLSIQFLGSSIDLSNIIGLPYSSMFRIEMVRKNSYMLERCNPDEIPTGLSAGNTEFGTDNRNIQDDNNAQALSKEEIIDMKNKGLSSQDIVTQLINNSKTFTHKTEFAQEKWLRKKSKKYSDYLQVLKPNIRLLSEVLMCNTASPNNFKLLGLRMDTLSQIITFVNFQPQGKYIVYENSCEGLICASLLNLTDCRGKLLNVITPNYSFNKRKALVAMKFPEEKHQSVININLSTFAKYANSGNTVSNSVICNDSKSLENIGDSEATSSISSCGEKECNSEVVEVSSSLSTSGNITSTNNENHDLKRKAESEESECKRTSYQERENEEVRQLLDNKADGLIVVCKEKPNDFVKEMIQFVAPSRSFVVFSQFQAPLIQLFQDLKQRQDVINIRLVENWLRSYQVLSDRTHPEINMLATGGYLLTGIIVTNN